MWSQYTELNLRKLGPRFRAKVAKARKHSRVLLQSFIKLAKAVTKVGGTWSFEWPKLAAGWKLPELHEFLLALSAFGSHILMAVALGSLRW